MVARARGGAYGDFASAIERAERAEAEAVEKEQRIKALEEQVELLSGLSSGKDQNKLFSLLDLSRKVKELRSQLIERRREVEKLTRELDKAKGQQEDAEALRETIVILEKRVAARERVIDEVKTRNSRVTGQLHNLEGGLGEKKQLIESLEKQLIAARQRFAELQSSTNGERKTLKGKIRKEIREESEEEFQRLRDEIENLNQEILEMRQGVEEIIEEEVRKRVIEKVPDLKRKLDDIRRCFHCFEREMEGERVAIVTPRRRQAALGKSIRDLRKSIR